MYSGKLLKALKSHGIDIGDRIRVKKGGEIFEGIVLPRPEGNPDYIVLKLDSGYNTGVKYDDETRIELVRKGKKKTGKRLEVKENLDLPLVSLIHTGGTIASKVDYETGGVSASFTAQALLQSVPEIFKEANIRPKLLFNVMSEDMNYKHWKRIAEETVNQMHDSYGVVISHGTDTMAYTSSALSFMIQNLGKPVVLVGSQRSSDRPSSDAFLNLLNAVRAAKLDLSGVYVNMHDTMSDESTALIRGTRARKMHTSRRDAFRPVNDDYIARIHWDGKVEFVQQAPRRSESDPVLDASFEPKTALVKVHPNFNPEIVHFLVDKGYKGIVFEGTGLGHLPINDPEFGLLDSVKRALDEGIIVAMTSQCLYGRVHPYVYANLRKLSTIGVLYLDDMIPETAYVKLGWVLGHDWDNRIAREMMLRDIAGEIGRRSLPSLPSDPGV